MSLIDNKLGRTILSLVAAMALTTACGDDGGSGGAAGDGGGISPGVGQGGAQDFGQFRAILDAGEIPGPDTLDDVGFFNEHKVELPSANCGTDVCLHGQLGVMANMISGSNCTLVLLGMNTPIDPSKIERPPLNLALAIDTSGSMAGDSIEYVREGLLRMVGELEPEDRVTLVTFSDFAEVQAEFAAGDDAELNLAIDRLSAGGATNIYDGLRVAYDAVTRHSEGGRQNRVILLSDGQATAGITNDAKLVKMSERYNEIGLGLSTIGMGTDFDPELMRQLSERGAGAFYFLEDPLAVREVFTEEVQSFLVPLAQDVRIDLSVESGYSLRGMYGTKLFELYGNAGAIEIPSLQIAHRLSDSDNQNGRRGGGGAIVAELLPRPDANPEARSVGELTMSYTVPGSMEVVTQSFPIDSPLRPGETPDDGHFSGGGVEKSFVMLNLFVGFQMASERASVGDDAGALSVLRSLEQSVTDWLQTMPDEDIEDDLFYVRKFIQNLRDRGAEDPPPEKNPPEPWVFD